ncbi:hypothetical protein F5B21DRAFT_121993 [Xylaria acuta]|nr:hypothetical protein F5B21DRAFT_121993 [Xylaria acuta]
MSSPWSLTDHSVAPVCAVVLLCCRCQYVLARSKSNKGAASATDGVRGNGIMAEVARTGDVQMAIGRIVIVIYNKGCIQSLELAVQITIIYQALQGP